MRSQSVVMLHELAIRAVSMQGGAAEEIACQSGPLVQARAIATIVVAKNACIQLTRILGGLTLTCPGGGAPVESIAALARLASIDDLAVSFEVPQPRVLPRVLHRKRGEQLLAARVLLDAAASWGQPRPKGKATILRLHGLVCSAYALQRQAVDLAASPTTREDPDDAAGTQVLVGDVMALVAGLLQSCSVTIDDIPIASIAESIRDIQAIPSDEVTRRVSCSPQCPMVDELLAKWSGKVDTRTIMRGLHMARVVQLPVLEWLLLAAR